MGSSPDPLAVLRKHWGFSEFRHCQREVVDAVLEGRDALVVMATGGGKSLCYQVPPMVLRKPAVVVSPLISLMEDQVMALTAKGISACFLGSAQLSAQVREDAWRGQYQFVYITPELAAVSIGRLQALHSSVGLALVAVDEAHCISEWGFDFRTDYRHLHKVREALPSVPFLALTATATPQVRDDIAANLRLKPNARKWVMSFERPNLCFTVTRKQPAMAANFAELLSAAGRGEAEPTIVYTLTKREAQEIATELGAKPGLQGRVGAYHGDMTVPQRRAVHAAFMHDNLTVVVATVAFGMGIDKSNVRHVYHFGAPASLEAYYQQAGRAGRDGLQSSCTLLWSAADAAKNAIIKSSEYQSAQGAAQRDSGTDAITAYIHSPGCRHRAMVEYFAPASWQGAHCRGGCDNCLAAQSGGVIEKDVAADARLLLAVVQRLREMGLGTAVSVLRGSRAQKMRPWMLDMTGPGGAKLHGAGTHLSEAWWKALAGMLTGRGFLASHTKAPPGQRAFAVVCCTDAGAAFLRSQDPLVMALSGEMLQHEKAARQAAEAAAAAAAVAAALAEQRDAAKAEEHRLFRALLDVRKAAAASASVAPFQLCSDFALWEIVHRRPGQLSCLAACQGCSEVFVRAHGQAFVDAVLAFCATSEHLSVGQPQRQPQHQQQQQQQASQEASQARQRGAPVVGAACSQAAACLAEPKGAASEAYQRFQAQGQTAAVVATTGRAKPINPMTVFGYLADAANSGLPLDWERATAEAALAQADADTIREAIMAHGAQGLGVVKRTLPTVEIGQIKLVAAMMNTQQHWFTAGAADAAGAAGGAPVAPAGHAAGGQPGAAENLGAVANGSVVQEGAAGGEPGAKRQRTDSSGAAGTGMATTPVPASAVAAAVAAVGVLTPEDVADLDDWD